MISVEFLTFRIQELLPEPHAGLLAGILFGVRTDLSDGLYEDLVRTGTLHIVALSGMNITIVIALINLLLLKIMNRRLASVLTVGAIIGFVWFVGPSPSVVRAAIMGSITLLAVTTGRQAWGLWSWGIAAAVMLFFRPGWIGDLSFQLSVMATLGIILFASKQETKKKFFWSVLEDDFRVTLAAQVFTIPIILFAFQRISLIAPVANILIGWVIGPMMTGGIFMSIMSLFFWPFAQLLAWIVWVPLEYILIVVTALSRIPYASLEW